MSAKGLAAPVRQAYWTRGTRLLLVLAGVGVLAALYRFAFGLDAATNLNDAYPWGIWKAVNVAGFVALGAGGFAMAAVAHIFQRHQFESLVRPALLTAMMGYTFAAIGLLVDLGRYYNIWHPLIPSMWQGDSALFEVAICVACYLTVLYIEFVPVLAERFHGQVALPGMLSRFDGAADSLLGFLDRTVGKVLTLFIIAGVVISCMHQSTLGTLMLVAPSKLHPLWFTPILPALFLLSAFMSGLAVVTLVCLLSARVFRTRPPMQVLIPLARLTAIFAGIYLIAKIFDLVSRDAYVYLTERSVAGGMFWLELGIGLLLPFALLLSRRVRNSPGGLAIACALLAGGVLLNRLNAFVVAYQPIREAAPYFPSVIEVLITVGLAATLVLVYRAIVIIFPVLPRAMGQPVGEYIP